jgi:hypothetical protein
MGGITMGAGIMCCPADLLWNCFKTSGALYSEPFLVRAILIAKIEPWKSNPAAAEADACLELKK